MYYTYAIIKKSNFQCEFCFFQQVIGKLAQDEYYLNITLRQGPNERGSLVKTDSASTSRCFLEARTGVYCSD